MFAPKKRGSPILATKLTNILGHHNMEHLIMKDTWSRIINGIKSSSTMFKQLKNK